MNRLQIQYSDELDLFRKDITSFVRLYDFLSQIIDYGDADLEKRYAFFQHLAPWIKQENQHRQILVILIPSLRRSKMPLSGSIRSLPQSRLI